MAKSKVAVKAKKSAPVKAAPPAARKAVKTSPAPAKVAAKTKTNKPAVAAPSKKAAAPAAAPEKKPVKMTNPLSKSDLEHYRKLLLEKRKEILGDVDSMQNEAFKAGSNLSNMPIHMADVGTDNFEQEFTLGLIESERQMLREIQEALVRIDDGTYGMCQGTGKPIPRVRLEAVPWAKYTIEYSRMLEQGKISRDSARDEEGSDEDDED